MSVVTEMYRYKYKQNNLHKTTLAEHLDITGLLF